MKSSRWSFFCKVPWWTWCLIVLWVAIALPVARLFVGFDRFVGDHEVGTYWVPFEKSTPSWDLWFQVPAQRSLELVPYDDLTEDERTRFLAYCKIRRDTDDLRKCYKLAEDALR